MNMLPQSNGLYRLKHKNKKSKSSIIKIIVLILLFILIGGFVFQLIYNFIGKEKIKKDFYYTKIENSKLEYDYIGEGEYTIVFEGAIGTNYYVWEDIARNIRKDLKVKTFLYNRTGYGFSEINKERTIEEQAKDLRVLLRKAGVSGKIIFVAEEYGSLIATTYAQMFSSSVAGVILINPLSEDKIKSSEFKKSIKYEYYTSIFDRIGSYIGLAKLRSDLGYTYHVPEFEDMLEDKKKEEYDIQKNQSAFRKAIEMEFSNLYFYNQDIQKTGILKDKFLYVITKEEDDYAKFLGSAGKTIVSKISLSEGLFSVEDEEGVINAITYVVNAARREANKKKT